MNVVSKLANYFICSTKKNFSIVSYELQKHVKHVILGAATNEAFLNCSCLANL